jgi:hypothetical protein
MIQSKFEQRVIYIVLISGFIIPIIQYISNRSLWYDEARLALNIINKNSLELFQPLDYSQVAPILFLQIEKLFSCLIPNSELGLRLFPLLSFWVSMLFFYKILKIIFNKPMPITFALSMFVFNGSLIYFPCELKQYMTDVLVLSSVYFIALKNYKKAETKYLSIAIIGFFSIFLSNVSPIILLSVGCFLLYELVVYKKGKLKYLIFIALVWTISFSVYYFTFIHEHPTREFMISYWSELGAFLPKNPLKIEFYQFLREKLQPIFVSILPLRIDFIYFSLILFFTGFILLIKRKSSIFILAIFPLFIHLLLSSTLPY